MDGIITFVCCDAQPRIIDVNKIIRQTIGNKVVDGIYCNTQPSTIVVEKIVRHTLGNIVMDSIYCVTQPRTIALDKIIRHILVIKLWTLSIVTHRRELFLWTK